ncbi:GlsB/YeaQ/YmgE family stress response membrane protein [Patescibacteria group bacterium]|nr:GlsB/YeaQ/YmgE family stress response membrane protein [Patescibacteria group bacterium]
MNILLWIILGGVAGWISSVIVKTNKNQGIFSDITLGVLGAILGGYIIGFFGQPGVTGFNIYSILVAVLGSVVLIWLGRMIFRTW